MVKAVIAPSRHPVCADADAPELTALSVAALPTLSTRRTPQKPCAPRFRIQLSRFSAVYSFYCWHPWVTSQGCHLRKQTGDGKQGLAAHRLGRFRMTARLKPMHSACSQGARTTVWRASTRKGRRFARRSDRSDDLIRQKTLQSRPTSLSTYGFLT